MDTTVNRRRTQVQTASGLNLLVGIWLFISAFVVPANGAMTTNNVICGIVVVVLAAIRAFGAFDAGWLSWLNALVGLWVIISPWAVAGGQGGPTQGTIACNVITGAAVVILGCWSAIATGTQPGGAVAYPDTTRPSFGR